MRKIVFIITFILPLLSLGQNWAPTGATWYYGFTVWTTTGYYKIENVGDTTINNIQCKKLKKTLYTKDLAFQTLDTIAAGTEYTYADINKVYIYKHNQFYTLYNFSANVGDTWTVPEIKHYNGCDTIGKVRVDSVGTMVINSQSLRYICVSLTDTSQKWGWSAKIVERIGPIKSFINNRYNYLFPVKADYCGMMIDEMIEGGDLRCYSDNSGFSYSTDIAPACDFLTSVSSINKSPDYIDVFPNPANDLITITYNNHKINSLDIVNINGQQIFSQIVNQNAIKVNVSNLSKGIYFLHMQTDKGIVARKFAIFR